MITYSEAADKVSRSRKGEPKIGHNTYLHEAGNGDIAVKFHWTDVITLHADGTYTLNTGGWGTVTTMRRLHEYGPARIYSEKGRLCIWNHDDPKTAPKITKCRTCHGTGLTWSHAWVETYGILPRTTYEVTETWAWNTIGDDGKVYPHLYSTAGDPLTRDDGQPLTDQPRGIRVVGQVVRHEAGTHGELPEPIRHPSVSSTCYRCHGEGRTDYGSRPNPALFHDGITVDGTGHVVGTVERAIESADDKAARLEAERTGAQRAYKRRQAAHKRTWIGDHLTVSAGRAVAYKAVDGDLESGYVTWGDGMDTRTRYPIGETVTAPDWDKAPRCGGGLHFSPSPRDARGYNRDATRYLACEVSVKDLVVIDDKIKAPSCRVLYEVDINGDRV